MMTDEARAEKNRAGVRRWYRENKEEYNEKRRERYAANKEAREKARQRAQAYRDANPTIERQLYREYKGKRVPVFSTGQIAQEMDRSPQMLRNWEKEGLIPNSTFPDRHRLYTAKQKKMIVGLGEVIQKSGGSWSHPDVKKAVNRIYKGWE